MDDAEPPAPVGAPPAEPPGYAEWLAEQPAAGWLADDTE